MPSPLKPLLNVERALSLLEARASSIPSLIDIVVRGSTNAQEVEPGRTSVADLDLSIVCENILPAVVAAVRPLRQELQQAFEGKVSITLVERWELASTFHHHGIKPLYYNAVVCSDRRLIGQIAEGVPYIKGVSQRLLRYDAFCNIVYLVHDVRNRIQDARAASSVEELYALIKRAVHTVRNAIYVISGMPAETNTPSNCPEPCKALRKYLDEDLNKARELTLSGPMSSTAAFEVESLILKSSNAAYKAASDFMCDYEGKFGDVEEQG